MVHEAFAEGPAFSIAQRCRATVVFSSLLGSRNRGGWASSRVPGQAPARGGRTGGCEVGGNDRERAEAESAPRPEQGSL